MTHLLVTTGPESSGKTTLAEHLSGTLQAPLVTEASRDYLTALYAQHPGYRYQQSDLLHIARLQHTREVQALRQQTPFLVCDTDLLVIMIWSEVKYGRCDPQLTRLFEDALAATRRTYLLCDPGIPWQHDPLRENPHDRDRLYILYKARLDALGIPYLEVTGTAEERLRSTRTRLSA